MKDNGSAIKPEIGTIIFVSLESNPTTGYTWAIDIVDQNIIQNTESGFRKTNSNLAGAASEQYFVFKPIQKGHSKISIKYFRNWEGDASVTKRFELDVEVV